MELITVLAVAKTPRQFGGETIWSVKVKEDGTKFGVWYNLHTPDKPSKGQTFNVEVTTTPANDGRTFYDARIVSQSVPQQQTASQPAPVPAPQLNINRTTPYTRSWSEYEDMARKAWDVARELEPAPDGARARASIMATFMIAYGEGKIDVSDSWPVNNSDPIPAMYAETPTHIELENALAENKLVLAEMAREWLGKSVLKARELSQPEAELLLNKIDWQIILARQVNQYCQANKIEHEKGAVLLRVSGSTNILGMTMVQAREAVNRLKMLAPL